MCMAEEGEVEEMNWTDESDEDLQHDLALTLAGLLAAVGLHLGDVGLNGAAWIEREMDCAESMRRELVRRGAALPEGCAFVYSPYARGKRELVYGLEAA